MKTGLITSDTYQGHDTGPGHPEQVARVTVINENLKKINKLLNIFIHDAYSFRKALGKN